MWLPHLLVFEWKLSCRVPFRIAERLLTLGGGHVGFVGNVLITSALSAANNIRLAASRTSPSRSSLSASCSACSEATIPNVAACLSFDGSTAVRLQRPGEYAALLSPAVIHSFRLDLLRRGHKREQTTGYDGAVVRVTEWSEGGRGWSRAAGSAA